MPKISSKQQLIKASMKLKSLFLGLFALAKIECIELNISPTWYISETNNRPNGWNQQLKASDYQGSINFQIIGLPEQVKQYRNAVYLSQKMPEGRYSLQVKATDSQGNSDKRDILFIVGSGQLSNLQTSKIQSSANPISSVSSGSSVQSNNTIITSTLVSSSLENKNISNRISGVQNLNNTAQDQNRLKLLLSQLQLSKKSASTSGIQSANVAQFTSTVNSQNIVSSTVNNPSIFVNNVPATPIKTQLQITQVSSQQVSTNVQNIPKKDTNTNIILPTSAVQVTVSGENNNISSSNTRNMNDLIRTYADSTQASAIGISQTNQSLFPESQVSILTSALVSQKKPSLTVNTRASLQSSNNVITKSDVTRQAIVERSVTASKSIANLIAIIQQTRANVNQFQKDIQFYKQQYNNALLKQREVQGSVSKAQNELKKIKSAIQGAQKTINQLRIKIANLETQKTALTRKYQIVAFELTAAKNDFQIVTNEMAKMIAEKNRLQQVLKIRQYELNEISLKITQCETIIKSNNQILTNISRAKKQANDKIFDAQNKVNDLQSRLKAARKQLQDANGQLQRIKNLQNNAPAIIVRERQSLDELNTKYRTKTSQIGSIKDQIQIISRSAIPGLQRQIDKVKSLVSDKGTQIQITTNSLTKTVSQSLEKLKKELNSANADLEFIKSQVSVYQTSLMKAYGQRNNVNTLLIDSKDNLEAIIKRYNQEYLKLQQININLQKARTEKEIADLAVEELLASRTDALPYAIVPLGDQFTKTAATLSGQGSFQSLQVTDWTHYLSESFGNAVSQNFFDPVNNLYPFLERSVVIGAKSTTNEQILRSKGVKTLSLFDERNGAGFPCENNAQIKILMSNCGNIQEIYENGFRVSDNRGIDQIIRISSCTKALANKPDYIPKNNDKIIWKGYYNKNGNQWRVSELMCIAS